MSYYGGYASYTSYSSYTSSLSCNDNYNYNSGYDSYSCTGAASYLLDAEHFNSEVRYGSFGSQCSNWQNTASTIMLWHLFTQNNNCAASWVTEKSVDISLEVDENEDTLEGFTDGVLAFMEQIGGHINLDVEYVNITICDSVRKVDTDFIHGLLAFLIEPLGIQKTSSIVRIHSANSNIEDVYAQFVANYDEVSKKNIKQITVVNNSIEEAKLLENTNQEELLKFKETGKRGSVISTIGFVICALLFFIARVNLPSIWQIVFGALSAIFIIYLLTSLYQLNVSKKSFGAKTFNSLIEKKTILEQLNDIEPM